MVQTVGCIELFFRLVVLLVKSAIGSGLLQEVQREIRRIVELRLVTVKGSNAKSHRRTLTIFCVRLIACGLVSFYD